MTVSAQERFAGVIKIVRFNVRFYAAAVLGLLIIGALVVSRLVPPWLELLLLGFGAAVTFWTLNSLVVSWYVYDHVRVTGWRWIPDFIRTAPRRWLNIHSGMDQSSAVLRGIFPQSDGLAIDIYDSAAMTEPSIARARKLYPVGDSVLASKFDRLPVSAEDRDTVLLLFAAHELRHTAHRLQLLREVARVLQDGGQVLLVEHLRDWPNFLAFGPGFFHFHSGRNWRHIIRNAGLRIEREERLTPFVRCFLLRR